MKLLWEKVNKIYNAWRWMASKVLIGKSFTEVRIYLGLSSNGLPMLQPYRKGSMSTHNHNFFTISKVKVTSTNSKVRSK